MKAGFTLIEVMASLALLSGLVLGMVGWSTALAETEAGLEVAEWERIWGRALEGMRLDLHVGDFDVEQPRVREIDRGWEIRGRRGQWVAYRYRPEDAGLYRGVDATALIGELAGLEVALDAEARRLQVSIEHTSGAKERETLTW